MSAVERGHICTSPGGGWWLARYAGHTPDRAKAHVYTREEFDSFKGLSSTSFHPIVEDDKIKMLDIVWPELYHGKFPKVEAYDKIIRDVLMKKSMAYLDLITKPKRDRRLLLLT